LIWLLQAPPKALHSSASSFSAFEWRAAMTKSSPFFANFRAAALPLPLEAPVITTFLHFFHILLNI